MKKKVKKLMAFLVAVVMIVASMSPVSPVQAAAKPQFTVKTSNANPRPGETFTAELWLEPNAGLTSFALVYTFDANTFDLVEYKKGETLKEMDLGMLMYDEEEAPGEVSVIADWDKVADMAGGQMCILTLKVKDNPTGTGKIAVEGATGTAPNPDGGEDVTIPTEDMATKVEDEDGNEIQGGNIPIYIELESLSLNKTAPFTMAKGTTEQLTVTAKPENALTGKKVEWTSSDSKVVTVDAEGNVKAVGAGTAKVTVKADGKTASVDITVNVPLTSIKLNKETLALRKGAEQTLEVTYNPEDTTDDKTVTWTSSDTSVATVDANGKVSALKDGTTTITAKVGDKTDTCVLTVKEEPLTGIELSETEITLNKNDNKTLEVIYKPADTTDDTTTTWSSSDEKVATVKDGVVTAKGAGNAVITATVGKFTATCKVNVEVALESISLDTTNKVLEAGNTATLKVTYNPEDTTEDKTVTWTTSNEKVATVKDGVVTAVAGGTATITAKTAKGLTAECQIKVPIHTTGIELDKTEMTILKRQTSDPLTVTFLPADTEDDKTVTWTSSDKSVATVDAEGRVTGVKEGTAVITATAVDGGFTAECTVTVEEVPLENIELNDKTPSELYKNGSFKIEVDLYPANTTDDVVFNYTSSDESVAKVSADGVVTAMKEGTVDITVTTADGRFTKVFTLKITEIPLKEISFKNIVSTLEEGQTAKLEILYNPDNTTDDRTVTWSSSDESVAVVMDGHVRAYKAGKTTITAKVGDKEISYELTVVKKKVPPQENNGGTQKPSTQKPSSPKTGDTVNVFSIMLVSVLSFIGAAWVITFRKHRTFR